MNDRITEYLAPHGWDRGEKSSFGACSDCDQWAEGMSTWWKVIPGGFRMLCRSCAKKEADKMVQRREGVT